jgi:hypothetical protein
MDGRAFEAMDRMQPSSTRKKVSRSFDGQFVRRFNCDSWCGKTGNVG